jgi:hypothetical protein
MNENKNVLTGDDGRSRGADMVELTFDPAEARATEKPKDPRRASLGRLILTD